MFWATVTRIHVAMLLLCASYRLLCYCRLGLASDANDNNGSVHLAFPLCSSSVGLNDDWHPRAALPPPSAFLKNAFKKLNIYTISE